MEIAQIVLRTMVIVMAVGIMAMATKAAASAVATAVLLVELIEIKRSVLIDYFKRVCNFPAFG